MQITFLGTSSMVPTKDRNHSGLLISYDTHGILVDCGEGTQRQLKKAGIALTKVTKILISHWHGDHVLGLPGLIQTLCSLGYDKTLEIYGPKGTKTYFEHMFKAFEFDRKNIDIKIKEIKEGVIFENREFKLEAALMEHNITCFGYAFIEKDKRKIDMKKVNKVGLKQGPLVGKLQDGKVVEVKGKKIKPDDVSDIVKGKKVAVIADTVPCKGCDKLAKNADILISEATYSSKLKEKGEEYGHMTAKGAALIASRNNVKKLILTHFSARYKKTNELYDDASEVFDNVECAEDLMKVGL